MMAAITPLSTRSLVRFDDTLLAWANRDQKDKGVSGLWPGLGDDPVRYSNGVPIYYDPVSNGEYTLDDYGNPTPLNVQTSIPVAIPGQTPPAGSGGSSIKIAIPGQTTPGQVQYTLPNGTKVTTTVNRPVASSVSIIPGIPNSYLLIGGAVLVGVMMLGRR